MVKVLWRFLGYITSTQSGFSMNRWVHGQGTVEVFRLHNFYTEWFLYEQVGAWSRYCGGLRAT